MPVKHLLETAAFRYEQGIAERAYLEYLSSGEKRAGWADLVTSPWLTFLRV